MSDNVYSGILQKLKSLEEVSGTSKKELFAKMLKEDQHFSLVCQMALDPYRTYGKRNVTDRIKGFSEEVIPFLDFYDVMEKLERRELSGASADAALTDLVYRGVPEELLLRIIRKDLRCGVGAETANKAIKDFVPSFKVALAKEYEEEKMEFPVYISPKFDGMRCIILIDEENVQFLSREGNAFPALSGFADAFLALGQRNVMYDSEVLAGNHFNDVGVVRRGKAKAEEAVFQVFDMLTLEEFNSRLNTPSQELRLSNLWRVLGVRDAKDPIQYCPHPLAHTGEDVQAAFKEYRSRKLEGVIIKDRGAPYQFKRSWAWTKLKDFVTFDLPIVDMIEGEGKFVGTLGALVVMFRGKRVKIGTGFSEYPRKGVDYTRDQLWAMRENLGSNSDALIVEVSAHEITPDGSLRHGRYHRIRHDKTAANINDGTDGKGE